MNSPRAFGRRSPPQKGPAPTARWPRRAHEWFTSCFIDKCKLLALCMRHREILPWLQGDSMSCLGCTCFLA